MFGWLFGSKNDVTPEVQAKLNRLPPQLLAQAEQNKALKDKLVELAKADQPPQAPGALGRMWKAFKGSVFKSAVNSVVVGGVVGGAMYALDKYVPDHGLPLSLRPENPEVEARRQMARAGLSDDQINQVLSSDNGRAALNNDARRARYLDALRERNVTDDQVTRLANERFRPEPTARDYAERGVQFAAVSFGLGTIIPTVMAFFTGGEAVEQEVQMERQLWAMMHMEAPAQTAAAARVRGGGALGQLPSQHLPNLGGGPQQGHLQT